MKKIIATIQCRMTSTRLPGKIMLPACDKPLLQHMVERMQRVPSLDGIIIATSTNAEDDCLEPLAKKLGVLFHRGSELDVLKRIVDAGKAAKADILVHMTSDCPLIDPFEVEKVIRKYLEGGFDYVSNVLPRSYPRGQDTQVLAQSLLELSERETTDPAHREHVTLHIVENPQRFKLGCVTAPRELTAPNMRMTLDYPEDYALIRAVFEGIYPKNPQFLLPEVMKFLHDNPDVAALTANLKQKVVRTTSEATW